ncbi:hypothetical protein ACJ73_10247 [Blastomyces percursus]|uniref:Uncharacterized protein n=1 Tax=Blastomyces percursus TaxID=1658174 RepID=A0A1J9NZY5_9EURO|nr:hypothetical protein ACJ73_10247 [Blastomyces percursus]
MIRLVSGGHKNLPSRILNLEYIPECIAGNCLQVNKNPKTSSHARPNIEDGVLARRRRRRALLGAHCQQLLWLWRESPLGTDSDGLDKFMDLKARLPHKAKGMQETRQSNASKHSPNDSSRAQGKSKSESESDWTDDECAVTDGSDFENDT